LNLRRAATRFLGWCPGLSAASEFAPGRDMERYLAAAMLVLFALSVWVWAAFLGSGGSAMDRGFYVNRVTLLGLLGLGVMAIYAWKRLKPGDWVLPEFKYNPWTAYDAPDIPINPDYAWGSGGTLGIGSGPGRHWGMDLPGHLRVPTDSVYYREFLESTRQMEARRGMGLPPGPLPREERDRLFDGDGFPFYPRRRSLLTFKLLAVSFILFLAGSSIASMAFYAPVPEGPLAITIGGNEQGITVYDSELDESFDYASLLRRKVLFREPFDPSEFASGPSAETTRLTLETAEEITRFLRETVGAPNVVAGTAGFLMNQTIGEAYRAIRGKNMGAVHNDEVDLRFRMGDIHIPGKERVHYRFLRHKDSHSGEESLVIDKMNGVREIWSVRVSAYVKRFHPWNEPYPYEVTLTRHPRGPEFNLLRWLSEFTGTP